MRFFFTTWLAIMNSAPYNSVQELRQIYSHITNKHLSEIVAVKTHVYILPIHYFISGCFNYVHGDSGSIESENYPGKYPDNYGCTTIIHSASVYPLQIQVKQFIQYITNCYLS